jgi:hypothetical protein
MYFTFGLWPECLFLKLVLIIDAHREGGQGGQGGQRWGGGAQWSEILNLMQIIFFPTIYSILIKNLHNSAL